jgi:gliding motility-associated-like protein
VVKNFNVNVFPAPQVSLGADISVCGQTTPTTLTASGGSSYQWSSGQNTAVISVNPSVTTTYIVTVTTLPNNCKATDDVKIIVNPIPLADAGLDKNICTGKSTTLTASGGTSYSWSNGINGSNNTVSPTVNSTYTVTVSNAFGCTSVDDVSVNVNPTPVISISPNVSICANSPTTLTATGGQNYTWSSGQNSASVNVNPSTTSTYTVTVSDVNGCTATAQSTININPITVDAGVDVNICLGQTINLSATASPNTTFLWGNGVTTANNSVSPTSTTTYTVTATDGLGCTKTDNVLVNVVTPPTVTLSPDVSVCSNQNVTLSASGGTSYLWSTGQNAANISVSPINTTTYSVSVSNSACVVTKQVQVTVIPPQNVVITAPFKLCSGQANLSASAGFTAYSWSNGQNLQNITITQSGTYTLTATDANGCKATSQTTVSNADKVTINGLDKICPNANNTISVNQNYAGYAWNNGQNTQSITISQAGTYTVTATDSQGCTVSESINVTQAVAPTISIGGILGICPNGATTLTVNGLYSSAFWSNGSTNNSISVNSIGNYSVTVTNQNACQAETSVNITAFINPNVKIQGNNVICTNGGNVSLTLNSTFASYLWSNNSTNSLINATQSGNYSVTVTDANGCKANDQFFISPQSVIAQITGSTSFCPGSSTVLAANATNAAAYLWSNGSISPTIQINTPGNVSVTITDSQGCKGAATLPVTLSSSLSPTIFGKTKICEGGESILDAGNGFKTYLWSDGSSLSNIKATKSGNYSVTVNDGACSGSTSVLLEVVKNNLSIAFLGDSLICANSTTSITVPNTFETYLWNTKNGTNVLNNISAGKYSLTVTDKVGCSTNKAIEVKTAPNPSPIIQGTNSFCKGGFTILNVGKYNSYLWNTASKDSSITVNTIGQYEITVTNSEGCIGSAFVNVTQTNGLVPVINGKTTLCKGQKITLTTDNYKTYLWSDGSKNNSIVVDKSGTYKVSVSDVAGCLGENTINIVEKNLVKPIIIGDTLFCEGLTKTLSINNQNLYNSFEWSDKSLSKFINVSESGIYSVSVSDGACSSQSQITVKVVKNVLNAAIKGDSIFCKNDQTTLSTFFNSSIKNYVWQTSDGKQTINGIDKNTIVTNGSNTWLLTVTDVYGCSASSSIKIIEVPLPSPNIKGDTLIINATPTQLDAGAGYSSYLWNTGENKQSVIITKSGIYEVSVTNQNNCKGVAKIVVKAINFIKPSIFGKAKICKNEKTKLEVANIFDTYIWSNGAKTNSIEVNKGGFYYVTVTKGGLIGKDTFEVLASSLQAELKTITDYNGFAVSCDGKNDGALTVQNVKGAIQPVSILWSNNATSEQIKDLKSGFYEVKIKDAFACEWKQNTTLFSPKKLSIALSSAAPNCKSAASGEIILKDVQNALLPLKINLNQQFFEANKLPFSIKNIAGGEYLMSVSDANNCTETATVKVEKQVIPTVTLGSDLEIYAGEEIQLTAQTNINPSLIFWSKIKDLSCQNCLNPIVKPSESGVYSIIVTDKFGCQATDDIFININKDFFVPSTFSPNGDQINDTFTLLGNKSLKAIDNFQIFDRWGNLVFEGNQTQPFWDGTFRNSDAAEGVYVYQAKVIFKDNSEKFIKGNVTLVR